MSDLVRDGHNLNIAGSDGVTKPFAKNVMACGICGEPSDRYRYGFQCRSQPGHMADLVTAIWSDLTPPTKKEENS